MSGHDDIKRVRRSLSLTVDERLDVLQDHADSAAIHVRFRDALQVLARHRVELVVVGAVAAALEGAPIETADLDVVPRRRADNVERLWKALEELDGGYKDQLGSALRPDRAALAGPGDHVPTRCGPIDVIGQISESLGYEELIARSTTYMLADHRFYILGLETLIQLKEEANRPEDDAVLAILRLTLAERGN